MLAGLMVNVVRELLECSSLATLGMVTLGIGSEKIICDFCDGSFSGVRGEEPRLEGLEEKSWRRGNR